MVESLGRSVEAKLTPYVLKMIAEAPKPTPTAEAKVVAHALKGMALSTSEIAMIANIAEPGRNRRARAEDYRFEELRKHDDLVLTRNPFGMYVRYVGTRAFNDE